MIVLTTSLSGILDANGIIGLAKGDCLDLLPHVFGAVFTPAQVVQEVKDPVSRAGLEAALGAWLVQEVPDPATLQRVPLLNREEDRHVLALALEHRPCVIVTGDRGLANRAKTFQIVTASAPLVVQSLAAAKLILAARPHLDRMRQRGFGIPDSLYISILQSLGE